MRRHLLGPVSYGAVLCQLPRMNAVQLANVLARAYGALGLNHLDRK